MELDCGKQGLNVGEQWERRLDRIGEVRIWET